MVSQVGMTAIAETTTLHFVNIDQLKTSYSQLILNPTITVEEKILFFDNQSQFPHCAQALYALMQEHPVAFVNILSVSIEAREKAFAAFERDHKDEWIKKYFVFLTHFANRHEPTIDNVLYCRQAMEVLPEGFRHPLSEYTSNPVEAKVLGILISFFNDKEFTENSLRSFFLANRVIGEYDALLSGVDSGWEDASTLPPGAVFIFTDDLFDTWFEDFNLGFPTYSWTTQFLAYRCMADARRGRIQETLLSLYSDDPGAMSVLMKLYTDFQSDQSTKIIKLNDLFGLIGTATFRAAYDILVSESTDPNNKSKVLAFLIVALDEPKLEEYLKTGGVFARTQSFALLTRAETSFVVRQLCSTPRKLRLLCHYLTTMIKSTNAAGNNDLELSWHLAEVAAYGGTLPFQNPKCTYMEERVLYRFVSSIPPLYLLLAGMILEVQGKPVQNNFISFIPYLSEEQCRVFAQSLRFTNMEEGIRTLLRNCKSITLDKYLVILMNLCPDIANEFLNYYKGILEEEFKILDPVYREATQRLETLKSTALNRNAAFANACLELLNFTHSLNDRLRSVRGGLSQAVLLFNDFLPENNKPEDLEDVVVLIKSFEKKFTAINCPNSGILIAIRGLNSESTKRPRSLSLEKIPDEFSRRGISLNVLEDINFGTIAALSAVGIKNSDDLEALGITEGNKNNISNLIKYLTQPKLIRIWEILNPLGFSTINLLVERCIAQDEQLFELEEITSKLATKESLVS